MFNQRVIRFEDWHFLLVYRLVNKKASFFIVIRSMRFRTSVLPVSLDEVSTRPVPEVEVRERETKYK